jgi:uncharacterized phage protein (TIGR01671 family)
MRTIKFRGKCCHSDAWVFGDLEVNRLDERTLIHTYYDDKRYHYQCDVRADTVGQFTGLYDKNGNEIYEGDILRYPAKDKYQEENFVSFEVFWHDNDCADNHVGWQIDRRHFHGCICGTFDISTFLPRYTKKMVIIGNIHDNPELLEGGEK